MQTRIRLSIPKGAIEAAKSALTVSSFLSFVGNMLDPFGADDLAGPEYTMIPKVDYEQQ